jgi:hypothetical protein
MTDVQEMDLRYGGRLLAFHVFINTDRDHEPLARDFHRVAKGPRIDASASWIQKYNDGHEAWNAMIEERKLTNAPKLKSENPRVLEFHLFVNTDADPYHIHKSILRSARGPRLDACVCWTEEYRGEDGTKVWTLIQKMSKQVAADPRVRPYAL